MLSPQEEQIIVALRQISQAIDLHSRALLLAVGLTAPQIAVLRTIVAHQSITPGALSEVLHLSPQTIAGILHRLEEKLLIVRERSARDRRSVLVRTTEAGESAAAKSPPLLRDRFRANLALLRDWERTQILATLQRVPSMMNADSIAVDLFLDNASGSRSEPDPARI